MTSRTIMRIGIDGTKYSVGYAATLILGNALDDNFEDILNFLLYKDIRDR